MSLSVCISVYTVGFLVFPFFYSFVDGWPLLSPRVHFDDGVISFLMCAIWPVAVLLWLAIVWWCSISQLGVSARKLCDRLVKTLHAYGVEEDGR